MLETSFILIPLVSFAASLLTFFSGFGLGTLLTPVFAIFFPVNLAVGMTAIVHFLNNLFKLALTGRAMDRKTVLRFGLPAIVASFAGAWLLAGLSSLPPLASYELVGRPLEVLPVKAIIAVLLVLFSLFEIVPFLKSLAFDPKLLPLGGLLSGFFGGLSGHQGALRSAFLVRAGLSKESFIATGVVLACLTDAARLSVYFRAFSGEAVSSHGALLAVATLSAFCGAYLGNRFLKKLTLDAIQKIVAIGLILLAVALGMGLI